MKELGSEMLNEIARYFDLQSARRTTIATGQRAVTSFAPVLPQYFAVSAGVIVEPFLRHYIDNGLWSVNLSALWGRIIFGLIIGLVILPGVYKSSFDPTKPTLIQLAALFPLGIGWQALFTSATKAVSG